MSWVDQVKPEDVTSPEKFADYVAQTCGTPWVTFKDMAILKKQLKEFWINCPNANWFTLVRTAQWARSKKKRPARVYSIIRMVPWAWQEGFLPELDPTKQVDPEVEEQIQQALLVEQSPEWRYRLIGAEGMTARREVLLAWQTQK